MFKALLKSIIVGAGIMIGMASVGVAGLYIVADKMGTATARATAGLEKANAEIAREFPAPRTIDNLEAYRACLHANDNGVPADAVDACRDEFRDWEDSPTFALELEKLQNMDSRVLEIMAAYDDANPTRYFD